MLFLRQHKPNNMTKPLFSILKAGMLAAFFIVGTSSMTSCAKKGCTDPTADNYDAEAEEDDDSCEDPRPKFVGSYNVSETGVTYPLVITSSSSDDRGIILNSNWGFQGIDPFNLSATVSQSNLTIGTQTAAGATINGSGSISGNILTITYSVTADGQTDTFTATATKL
jgi:hypothetical protein